MRRICLNGSIPAKHILADKRKINTNRTKTTKMKQQTAKLILLAAFLFGAVVIIRLQEEPSSSFIGLAAEHSSEHGSDIGCADLRDCCTRSGGTYAAFGYDPSRHSAMSRYPRKDEKCCNPGETPYEAEITVFGFGCNAASNCQSKCKGIQGSAAGDRGKQFLEYARCCRTDQTCFGEPAYGTPVCSDLDPNDPNERCQTPVTCSGKEGGHGVDVRGVTLCCSAGARCLHTNGFPICSGGCSPETEIECPSANRRYGITDEERSFSICCNKIEEYCIPGSQTNEGRPFCIAYQ